MFQINPKLPSEHFRNADLKCLNETDIKLVLDANIHRCTREDIRIFLDRWKKTNDTDEDQKQVTSSLISDFMQKSVYRVFFEYKRVLYGGQPASVPSFNFGATPPSSVMTPPPVAPPTVVFQALKTLTLIGVGLLSHSKSITIRVGNTQEGCKKCR